MKSVPVTRNLLRIPTGAIAAAVLLLMLVCASSCQKEPEGALQEQQATQKQSAMRSSVEMEMPVVQHLQWLLDNVVPLVADEAVAAALKSGNTNTAVVTTRLQALGFSNFEQFAQAFNDSGSTVQAAISSGSLTQQQLLQIVGNHSFDYSAVNSALGHTSALPCTQQLETALALTPMVVLAASGTGWGAVIAGTVHVVTAYVSYKACLRATYPGVEIP
ncbi:MAG: hypothetical protein JNJ90_20420 [Saprospiraceae bacterium]|jgi:hypothetical protein|nr:hypothetical protein [Saprospiraceae bacterium]